MKCYFVYILHCSDNSYYVGITNSLERRLEEHQSGFDETAYTFCRRPVKLVWSEVFLKPMDAIRREKQIKKWSRKKKEALIRGDMPTLTWHAKATEYLNKHALKHSEHPSGFDYAGATLSPTDGKKTVARPDKCGKMVAQHPALPDSS